MAMLKSTLRTATAVATKPAIRKDIVAALVRRRVAAACGMARTVRQRPSPAEKVVSCKYRFLWICNPKVASRSTIAALTNAAPDAELIRGVSMRELLHRRPEIGDYYSFAFIRHPASRALSWYWEIFHAPRVYAEQYHLYRSHSERMFYDPASHRYVSLRDALCDLADPVRKEKKNATLFRRFHGLRAVENFEQLCEWLNTPYGSDAFADPHFLSQHRHLRLGRSRLPDFVGRFETIDEDLRALAAHIGMPTPVLPTLNTMAGWQSTPQDLLCARSTRADAELTARSRELLKVRYGDDLALWRRFGRDS